jgi:hypothetical protein
MEDVVAETSARLAGDVLLSEMRSSLQRLFSERPLSHEPDAREVLESIMDDSGAAFSDRGAPVAVVALAESVSLARRRLDRLWERLPESAQEQLLARQLVTGEAGRTSGKWFPAFAVIDDRDLSPVTLLNVATDTTAARSGVIPEGFEVSPTERDLFAVAAKGLAIGRSADPNQGRAFALAAARTLAVTLLRMESDRRVMEDALRRPDALRPGALGGT